MPNDPLEKLLRSAERSLSLPETDAAGLVERVRAEYRRRQRRNRVAAGAAAFLLFGAAYCLWPGGPNEPIAKLPPVERSVTVPDYSKAILPPQQTIAELHEEIERQERLVAELLTAERTRKLAREAAAKSAQRNLESSTALVERTALTLLLGADHSAARPEGSATARADYQLVVEYFPHTVWAAEAQQKLNQLAP